MAPNKTSNTAAYTGIFTAVAASVCCISPVLALIAGTSDMEIEQAINITGYKETYKKQN
ncbi:hypothetical protein [Marixanthomonas spongiae]|uniref:hypothetical protein n=1 Tax=Marixanthomonas spongiae TaxID=2174845 RepID=UPI0026C3BF20